MKKLISFWSRKK